MEFQAFPVDLFLQIAELLDRETVLNLRLVSHSIHDVITPVALRNVRVFVGERQGDDFKVAIDRRLQTCSSALPNVSEHAKHLRISMSAYYVSRFMSKELLSDLWKTIAKLHGVTSLALEWEGGYNETDESLREMPIFIEKAVDSLFEATGGRLEKLTVNPSTSDDWFPQVLSKFRGLTSLKIVRDPWGYRCNRIQRFNRFGNGDGETCSCVGLPMTDIFGPLIAANPDIEEMEVVVGCQVVGFDPNFVLPATLTKLTKLTVGGLNFGRKGFLRTQTSIDPAPLRNLRHLATPSIYGPLSLDMLWTSMRQAQTTLETLITKQVSLPLVQYLASFSGLRSLEILRIQDRPECASKEITSTFLTQVLPRHAETLETLHISFDTDVKPIDGWTFDVTTWPSALSHLHKLRDLAIHPPSDPEASAYSPTEDSLLRNYQAVIESVETLPGLEKLTLEWITMSFGCGTGMMNWRRSCFEKLNKVTPLLVGRTGKPGVLQLFNGEHLLRKREEGEGVGVGEGEGEGDWRWGWPKREGKKVILQIQ